MNIAFIIPPDPEHHAGPLSWPLLDHSCFEHSLRVLAHAGARRCRLHVPSADVALGPYLEAAERAGLNCAPAGNGADASDREPWLIIDASLYICGKDADELVKLPRSGVTALLSDRHPTNPYTEHVVSNGGNNVSVERIYCDSPKDGARAASVAGIYLIGADAVRAKGLARFVEAIRNGELDKLWHGPTVVEHRPGAYRIVNNPWECLAANRQALRYDTRHLGGEYDKPAHDVWLAEGASIEEGVSILGPVLVGRGASIAADALVVGPTSIGPGCRIGPRTIVHSSLLMAHANVGADCRVLRSVMTQAETLADGAGLDHTILLRGAVDGRVLIDPDRFVVDVPPGSDPSRTHVRRRYRMVKRIVDIAGSLAALAATAPLYPFIALAIKLDSAGGVFFGHVRQGRGGGQFKCWKFRTMCADADRMKEEIAEKNEADGPQFVIRDDPRLTRVGRFLRKMNLDEVPQFWNVLMGHMSLVGPRPSPDKENVYCPAWRRERLSVRPGITGLWQVSRERDPAKGDFHEWIRYDLEYVRNPSLSEDLRIMYRTIMPTLAASDWEAPEALDGAAPAFAFALPQAGAMACELSETALPAGEDRSPEPDEAAAPGVGHMIGTLGAHAARLGRNMILARMLMPQDFGVMAAILAVVQGADALAGMGQRRAGGEDRSDDPAFLSALWTASVVRAAVVCSMLCIAAPWLAGRLGAPATTGLLRFSLLAILFAGLTSPRVPMLHWQPRAGRWCVLTLLPAIAGTALAVVLATRYTGIPADRPWALAAAFTAEAFLAMLLSFVVAPFLPRPGLVMSGMKRVLRLAKRSAGGEIPAFVLSHADVLAVAFCLPPAEAGVYFLVRLLAVGFAMALTRGVLPGMLPALSAAGGDNGALRNAVLKATSLTMVLAMPFAAMAPVFAGETLEVVCSTIVWRPYTGAQLLVPSSVLCLLLLAMLLHVLSRILGQAHLAAGCAAWYRRHVWIKTFALCALIVPAARYSGLQGAAHVVLAVSFFGLVSQMFSLERSIDLDRRDYAAALFPGMACAQLAFFIGYAVQEPLRHRPVAGAIVALLLCCASWMAGIVWLASMRGPSSLASDHSGETGASVTNA